MKLPFGLDLWSVLVGAAVAYFVVPFVLSKVSAMRASGSEQA